MHSQSPSHFTATNVKMAAKNSSTAMVAPIPGSYPAEAARQRFNMVKWLIEAKPDGKTTCKDCEKDEYLSLEDRTMVREPPENLLRLMLTIYSPPEVPP